MTETTETPRGRLRFLDLEFRPSPDGHGTVVVRMEWRGRTLTGEASGIATREGDLRMGANASLATIQAMAGDAVEAELVGVKAVRAFDAWVVIASVRAQAMGRDYRLLGAKAVEEQADLTRGAAIAVLDSLNRVLEKIVREVPDFEASTPS
jgi:hypothetical protein